MTRCNPRNTALFRRCLAVVLAAVPAVAAGQDGAALYRDNCSACHDAGIDRAPGRDVLQGMSAERVLTALENGPMISMAARLTGGDRRAIAQFITDKTLSARDLSRTPPQSAMCPVAGASLSRWTDSRAEAGSR